VSARGSARILLLLGGVLAVWVGSAAAELAEAAKTLTAPEIRAALTDRPFEFRTTKTAMQDPRRPGTSVLVDRTDGDHVTFRVLVRGDGSIIFRCTRHFRAGGFRPCSDRLQDVGIWGVEGDQLCWRWTEVRAGQRFCFDFRRDGASLRARQASGPPSTMDGALLEFK
jgi:hypothetical protein